MSFTEKDKRKLGIKTSEFVDLVNSGEIVNFLKEKFPKKNSLIEMELG